jgi:hypothetical protein
MSLNPGQFKGPLYHGTTFDVQGKDIVPATRLAESKSVWKDAGHSGQQSSSHAFATESENTAWQFGSLAGTLKRAQADAASDRNRSLSPDVSSMLGQPHPAPEPVPEVGRVRVHTVAPNPLMQRGVFHADNPAFKEGDQDLKEWKAPAFRVTGTQDIMPGRQGTFPQLNWNQFKTPGSSYQIDANHPSNTQAAERPVLPKKVAPAPAVDEHQMDMFSGKTVGEHAENDETPVGDYHRNNLFGRL